MTANAAGNASAGRHLVHMEQRRLLQISGVADVHSFHENEILLRVDSGTMVITGEELHIGKLLLEEGKVEVNGKIDGVVYEKPRSVKRLLWRKADK